MEHLRLVNQAQIQLFKAQAGIRSRLPGKGKFPISLIVKGDEGQGGKHILVCHNSPGFKQCFGDVCKFQYAC